MLTGEQEAVSWPRALTLHLGVSATSRCPEGEGRQSGEFLLIRTSLPHHFTVTNGEPSGRLHQPKTPVYIFRLNITRKTQVFVRVWSFCAGLGQT